MSKYSQQKKDLTNGDHSIKKWFSIMWGVGYIQFFVGIFFINYFILNYANEIVNLIDKTSFISLIFTISGFIISPLLLTLIAYKMSNYWKNYKDGII